MGDERFAPYFRGMTQPVELRLGRRHRGAARAGRLHRRQVWLEERKVQPPEPREYVRSVGLNLHLARIPDEIQDEFIDAVLGSMLRPLQLDYVRLNMSARKA